MIQYKNAIRSIQNNNIDPIYYLKGNDHFLQNFFIKRLSKAVFVNNKINKSLLLPHEMTGKEIIDNIISSDLFQTRRLFIIREPQQIKGKPFKDLLDYCSNPITNHFLILISDNYMDNGSLTKSVMKIIDPINVSTPYVNDLYKWARFFFKQHKKSADHLIIEEIVENYGDSLFNIKNEIDKLCILIDSEILSFDDFSTSNIWSRSRQRWELLYSIGRRDLDKSIKLTKEIIGNSDTMISLIYPLTTFFQELLYAKMNNGTFIKPNSYIPLSNSIKKNLVSFSNGFSKKQIEKSLKKLKQIDRKQKTSKIDDESDLIHFIYDAIG